MRIGIDVRAAQAEQPGREEISRYSRAWTAALLSAAPHVDVVLYAHADLPTEGVARARHAIVRPLNVEPALGDSTPAHALDRLARENPDDLDVLVLLDPLDRTRGVFPPAPPPQGLPLAALVHDLSAFLYPNDPDNIPYRLRDHRGLEEIRRYPALLFPSEAVRADGTTRLRLRGDRTATVGLGVRPPRPACSVDEAERDPRAEHGIARPYFLLPYGTGIRKNPWALIDAFSRLPEELRSAFQFVIANLGSPAEAAALHGYADARGVGGAIVPLARLDEAAVAALVRGSVAVVNPSVYEGSGLSILEAMAEGAVVIAGDNSAQAEAVGDAGLTVNPQDADALAAAMKRVIEDPSLARDLSARARQRASLSCWEDVAERSLECFDRLSGLGAKSRRRASRPPRRRIALFSPFPPMKSGISDYALSLAEELQREYAVELFHDSSYVPEPCLGSDELPPRDFRLFDRYAAHTDYYAVLYQMGNSGYHNFLYDHLRRHPGIVTLHDFGLAGFQLQYLHATGADREAFLRELLAWYPAEREAIHEAWTRWQREWDWDRVSEECVRAGWYLNGPVLDRSERVVVHSPWCVERAAAWHPDYARTMDVIPLGRHIPAHTPEQRAAIRARFQLPPEALVVASFGFVHPNKLNAEAVEAFQAVAAADPTALFLLVGEEADLGLARRQAEQSGVADQVRFLGRRSESDFHELLAVTDLGVNLRRPPTNGETSAALLDLLGAGVATIVTDVATFSDYSDRIVRKVRWERDGVGGLRRALTELAFDREVRLGLGRAARSFVAENHDWPKVARRYAEVIECCRESRMRRRASARAIGA